MAFSTPTSKLYENQYDALVEKTDLNPYMKYSKRASSNKALNTKRKDAVGAINELLAAQQGLQTTTVTSLQKINGVVGDHSTDPQLKKDFDATGYKNLTEGIIDLKNTQADVLEDVKKIVQTITKDVCFVYPKMAENSVSLEQYIPFKGKLTRVIARCSKIDNAAPRSGKINVVLQHASKDNVVFNNIQNIVLNDGEYFVEYDLSDNPVELDNEILKVLLVKFPKSLINFNIVATIELDSGNSSTTPGTPVTPPPSTGGDAPSTPSTT